MCFAAKDHRLNMLHSLCVTCIVLGCVQLLNMNFGAVGMIFFAGITMFVYEKTWFLVVAGCSVCGCVTNIAVGMMMAMALYAVGTQHGLIADMQAQEASQGIMSSNHTSSETATATGADVDAQEKKLHIFGAIVLVSLFFSAILNCACAYYSYQVYHYPGDPAELKDGPGVDGKGHVKGVHDDGHNEPGYEHNLL